VVECLPNMLEALVQFGTLQNQDNIKELLTLLGITVG
jgi:hypothetical protein